VLKIMKKRGINLSNLNNFKNNKSIINHKRGQAAMEFLMTYGWALLVVLIAIAALAFFGLLNPDRFLPERCEIAPGLTCMDFNAEAIDDGHGNITILLNNGIGQTMRNVTISIGECGDHDVEGNDAIITSGYTQRFNITNCKNMNPNFRFRSDMTIIYQTRTEGHDLQHSRTGNLVVQVQKIESEAPVAI
jgi:uncharacterized protein (UPF0333 family)